MKKLLPITLLVTVCFVSSVDPSAATKSASQIASAQTNRAGSKASRRQVQGAGVVIRVLADDNNGSRHQRFILRLPSGQTLLVAHNIDIASRVDDLEKGDKIEFHGEYTWNSKGGVVHWTHRDPAGRHVAGWLKYKGRIFQ